MGYPMTHEGVARAVYDQTTVDVGGRGTIGPITDAVDSREPPPLRAAETLHDAVDPGDVVAVLTGFPIPPTMVPETDGPPGAVALAAALDRGLDADVVVACEPAAVEICEATANAAGLSAVDRAAALGSQRTVAVEAFPVERAAAVEYAADVAALEPAAVVAVEKVGPNRGGVYHNMAGYDVSDATAKVDELYDELDDVPTVSVGDAGNEIGMGEVEAAVRDAIPYGETCQCDCEEGIAGALGADVLVPATVSNWGASAIAACLSLFVGDVLHDPAVERRMLEAASAAGGIDGIRGGTTGWCDGIPTESHAAVVRLLGETVAASVHDDGGGELAR